MRIVDVFVARVILDVAPARARDLKAHKSASRSDGHECDES